ncbi:hypothetical protein GCM10011371_11740 [Novosphingobium marinum]|uniref:Two-component system CheB/CheR fusion protein n=1 Tax=Novosphingobium marinum TaxID=1514948 RepID=A0A7Z0BUK1_9SPHN|nr:chemotaxis protein CheB [Novosphingobium marinum]NYH95283.1 two-component system CheB/CheR fusion protein [Novosphingobium marinum]GGC25822.1 hypothetical protein GCM10011371_11740 [Novosphingobium marinum]
MGIQKERELDFPIVAVGASAGGVEALKNFVSELNADDRAAFVILLHLAPDHESQLTDILSRSCALPVSEASQDMPINSGNVYVLTPGRYLTIVDHGLFVEPAHGPRGQRMPIDHFMRSLADSAGPRAVGVVLSGTGNDGSIGLRAIKGAGGVSLVQSPENALYDGMPRSAIEAGVVDEVGSIDTLVDTIRELSHRIGEGVSGDGFARREIGGLLSLIKARTGQDFAAYKFGTLRRRIRRRMNLLRFDDLGAYTTHVRSNEDELRRLFEDLLINVTCFFRDPAVWEQVAEKVIQPLLVRSASEDRTLRVWVPACSSGEEAYTLAILLEEAARQIPGPTPWQIFATDLDTDAVARGREAQYPESIADDVGSERLKKYFIREATGWRVNKELRERVVFAHQDVLTDPPFSKLDMVSCRNLLIYLDSKHQNRLLETFHFALNEGGMLLLGTSETTGAQNSRFTPVDTKSHLYRRCPGQSMAQMSARHVSTQFAAPSKSGPRERRGALDLGGRVRNSLLERYAPPSVAVRASGDIAFLSGNVRRFLAMPPGEPSNNVFDMVPASLRSRVREAVRAVSQGESPSHRSARVRLSDDDAMVCIECVSIEDEQEPLYLVTFIEQEEPDPASAASDDEDRNSAHVEQLERELEIMREDLQTTVEELETSNEELKASHEEAMAANEELQSANEELETSREELQSLNEELITVNNQLEEKVTEVEKTTDDLRNLLTSTRLPVLFLDPELRISGFTPAMRGIVELRDSDVGRPIADLAFSVEDADLLDDAKATLNHLSPREREVRAGETVYVRRVQPYRTSDERISGVVVTYVDISQQANMSALLASRERQQRLTAEISQKALGARDLPGFLNELCATLRVSLDCDYAKVLKFESDDEAFSLVAGAGWKAQSLAKWTVPTGVKSQGGYTLKSESPVLVSDFREEKRFEAPSLLIEHKVLSGISCLVEVGGKPWGVIGVHDRDANHFAAEDVAIVQAAASTAAATIRQIEREASLARDRLMLSLAMKTAGMGIWQYDPATKEVYWDERLRELMGVGPKRRPKVDDFMGMVVSEDFDRVDRALAATAERGEPFEQEFRLRRADGSIIWLIGQAERVEGEDRVRVIGINADITARKEAEEHSRFMMRELDHRVKNVLAIIVSIAAITSRDAPDLATFTSNFEQRLRSMARTHSLLAEHRWRGAKLSVLIEDELAHAPNPERVETRGPEIAIAPSAAQSLAMALHELTTNAIKYGSLSVPEGKLLVEWSVRETGDGEHLDLVWQESDGPAVRRPKHRGFGSTVIERIMKSQLRAETTIDFRPEGLVVTCSFPLEKMSILAEAQPRSASLPGSTDLTTIRGRKVLVLDDEWLVAEQTAQALSSMGAEIVGPFHSLKDALEGIDNQDIALAVLDYNIDGDPVTPLAMKLAERDVPVIIVSGYGSNLIIEQGIASFDFLAKPVSPATLLAHSARAIALGEEVAGKE